MALDEDDLRWVESGGGPLIVLPLTCSSQWQGVNEHDLSAGDYARAVAVSNDVGPISVGQERALVLAGDPAPTFYLKEVHSLVRVSAVDEYVHIVNTVLANLVDVA